MINTTFPHIISANLDKMITDMFKTFPWSEMNLQETNYTQPKRTPNTSPKVGRPEKTNAFDVINRDFNLRAEKNEDGLVEKYVLEIEHTPFAKSDIHVTLEGQKLHVVIGGEKKTERKGVEISRNIVRETSDFYLDLTGLCVIKKKISAKCEDGILKIDLPVYQTPPPPPPDTEIPIS
jgi:HSP20 family molecular chaperone IbpA